MPTPRKQDSDEDLRFAPASEAASRKELLARADLLAQSVVSGGVPRREEKAEEPAS